MNKKTVFLGFLLVVLLVVALYRWETLERGMGAGSFILFQKDRLTSLVSVQVLEMGESITLHQKPYVTHGVTVLLYSAMGMTVIALIKEIRLLPQKNKEE